MSMSGSLNLEVFQARWGKGQGLGWRCEQRVSRAGNGTHGPREPVRRSQKSQVVTGGLEAEKWGGGVAVGKGTAEE